MAYISKITPLGSNTAYDIKAKLVHHTDFLDTSNWQQTITYHKATDYTATYPPGYGYHNTGDTNGAFTIIPYETNTQPWGGTEGLYIGKTAFKWENNTILHSGNYTTYLDDVYVKKSGDTMTGSLTVSSTSPHLYLKNTSWTKGTNPTANSYSAIEFTANNGTGNKNRISLLETTVSTSGESRLHIYLVPHVEDSTSWSGIILSKTPANVLSISLQGTTTVTGNVNPSADNTYTLGASNVKWKNVYATTFTGNLSGNASSASKANLTTTANAVAYYTDTAGTFGSKASANGALYATAANGALTFGTLPIAQGGTGKTSALAAANNLLVPYIGEAGIEISANTDLNTYNQTNNKLGTYYSQNSTRSATLTNPPINTSGFKLWAIGGYGSTRGHQLIWGTSPTPYCRTENGTAGTYTDWAKLTYVSNNNTAVGGTTTPVYVNADGKIIAGTALKNLAYKDSLGKSDVGLGNVTNDKQAPAINGVYYGVCSTEQATKAKDVTLTNGTNFSLATGCLVAVKFTNASAAATMTLNVNNTGAKNLYLYGTTTMSSGTTTNGWRAGAIVLFVYDGTSGQEGWRRIFWENSTYWNESIYVSTAADNAAKVGNGTYTLEAGKFFQVLITNANTAASALTLNINNKGAKPIYINGAASSSSNHTLPQGYYLVHYDGTNYYFRTDTYITGSITGSSASVRPINLTNQDLNNIIPDNTTYYYGAGQNSVTNKPTGVDSFGMVVYRVAQGYKAQELTTSDNKTYRRIYGNSSWTAWTELKLTDNNTATAADNILDGSNSGTQITYAPYSSQQSKLSFDTSTTNPSRTDRLNLNGYLYATKLYSGGNEVLTSHQSLSGYIPKSTLSGAYDIMYSSAASTPTRLAANTTTTKKFLRMTGTGSAGAAPAWDTVTKSDVGLGNVTNDAQIPKSIGTTKGDIIYWSAANTPARLAIGSTGKVLKVANGIPSWGDITIPYGETLPSTGNAGDVFLQTSAEYYELPTGGSTGRLLMKKSTTDRDVQWTNNVYVSNDVLFGAAWNDYAEYRERLLNEFPKAGNCVIETGEDSLRLSTQRMQPGAEIVSDTFGFAIGKTIKATLPIAVSGRVLAYTYEDREEFKKNIGKPVCSGPNGTVSIMTDEEYRNYGYCAIGTISSVPSYETWGENNIKVDNRVWIKVR